MIRRLISHIGANQAWYIWVPLFLAGPFLLGKIAQFLNHGKPLLDDPTSIFSNSLEWVPVNIALIVAFMYSNVLNNSLNQTQYAAANWKDKLVDNVPELVVFLSVLIHLHLHG